MPSERRLHGDLRCLHVAHLTHEDHVGVLAQNCSQTVGKRGSGQPVDLDLVDVVELILDRVLDCGDVSRTAIEFVQRRVERGRLSGARRSADHDQPVGRGDEAVQLHVFLLSQAQLVQWQQRPRAIEQAHHDLLAPHGLHRGDADIDIAAVELHGQLAVLAAMTVDDVHLREEFQT